MNTRLSHATGAVAFCLCLTVSGVAADPTLQSISPRGLQLGGDTLLTITGERLGATPRLIAPTLGGSRVIESQEIVESSAKKAVLRVRCAADAAPGIYPVRVLTDEGVSGALLVGIDHLPERAAPESDSDLKLPLAISGALTGATRRQWGFEGLAGQRVVCEVLSQRFGAKLNPVLRLLDEDGNQLAFAGPTKRLHGDARLIADLPRTGRYTLSLQDRLFRGAAPGHFRVVMGELNVADRVFPTGARRGAATEVTLQGAKDSPLSLQPDTDDPAEWRRVAPPDLVGSTPLVRVSQFPELVEGEFGADQATPAPPLAISGVLSEPGQRDVFRLPKPDGKKWRFELYADRIGSPLDGVLVVRGPKGKQLGRGDDQKGTTDPAVEVAPSKDLEFLEVVVHDLTGRSGADCLYRLEVTPAGQPSVAVALETDRLKVASGNRQVASIRIRRSGYRGPVRIEVLGDNPDVAIAGGEIQANSVQGLIGLSCKAGDVAAWFPQLVAKAVMGGNEQTTVARVPNPGDLLDSAVATRMALVRTKADALSVDFGELSDRDELYLGGRWSPPLRLQRGGAGKLRFTLLTSQVIPKKKVKKNNKDVVVDDLDRAIRLDGPTEFAADQTPVLTIVTPTDLKIAPYDLALRVDRLGTDWRRRSQFRNEPDSPHAAETNRADVRQAAVRRQGDRGRGRRSRRGPRRHLEGAWRRGSRSNRIDGPAQGRPIHPDHDSGGSS